LNTLGVWSFPLAPCHKIFHTGIHMHT
jgi:hypothetical protein